VIGGVIIMAEMAVILHGLPTSNEGEACYVIKCLTTVTNSK